MEQNINSLHKDITKLQNQIEVLNRILLDEGKLTPWAKKELAKARAEKEENYISLDDL